MFHIVPHGIIDESGRFTYARPRSTSVKPVVFHTDKQLIAKKISDAFNAIGDAIDAAGYPEEQGKALHERTEKARRYIESAISDEIQA